VDDEGVCCDSKHPKRGGRRRGRLLTASFYTPFAPERPRTSVVRLASFIYSRLSSPVDPGVARRHPRRRRRPAPRDWTTPAT